MVTFEVSVPFGSKADRFEVLLSFTRLNTLSYPALLSGIVSITLATLNNFSKCLDQSLLRKVGMI